MKAYIVVPILTFLFGVLLMPRVLCLFQLPRSSLQGSVSIQAAGDEEATEVFCIPLGPCIVSLQQIPRCNHAILQCAITSHTLLQSYFSIILFSLFPQPLKRVAAATQQDSAAGVEYCIPFPQTTYPQPPMPYPYCLVSA